MFYRNQHSMSISPISHIALIVNMVQQQASSNTSGAVTFTFGLIPLETYVPYISTSDGLEGAIFVWFWH